MTIRKRIERLETKRGKPAGDVPSVIFLCCGETGEPLGAILVGGGSISREQNESREAFEARAMAGAPAALSLPANGRDALATGKAPQWAQSELALLALRQKHDATP